MRSAFAPLTIIGICLLVSSLSRAESPADQPRPIPLTRPELKQLIEDVKIRVPRIPLPEPTDADRQELGDQAVSYESALRYYYLKDIASGGGARRPGGAGGPGTPGRAPRGGFGGGREQEPAMSLDYAFKTQLFWIASRVNNCQYCLGHQESKLLNAGLSEDEIAALDGDWSGHPPAQQAAFAYARKLSLAPQEISDADFESLRKHYTDLQILEMTLSVAGNNTINRWKEGVGVPQRKDEGGYSRQNENASLPSGTYLTPTGEKYRTVVSKTAAVTLDPQTGAPTRLTVSRRPPLESRAEVEQILAACKDRQERLPLVDDAAARAALPADWPAGPLPRWVRLLANFPREGVQRANSIRMAETGGDLSPVLKAQVAWIIARQDRAWYAADRAKQRLNELGQSDDLVFALDGDWSEFTPRDRALFTVARNLGTSPVVLTDREVAEAVKLAGPRDVVQTVHLTTISALFDRVTEAARLSSRE